MKQTESIREKLNKGFTLMEMMVVIAIISVLIGIIMPTVTNATKKAKAATDAANLRAILGLANSIAYTADKASALEDVQLQKVQCKLFDGADLYMVYEYPGFVDVFYLDGSPEDAGTHFYGLKYMTDVAASGESDISTDKPTYPGSNVEWLNITELVEGS